MDGGPRSWKSQTPNSEMFCLAMIDIERVWCGRSWSDAASARRSRSFRISDFELGTRAIDGVGMTESNAERRGGRARRYGISSGLGAPMACKSILSCVLSRAGALRFKSSSN
jgi:hypothetical protein